MATCDIQELVNEAACLGCLPVGQLQAIKTGLLCDYLVDPSNPPCVNLIPEGAAYDDLLSYVVSNLLEPFTTYQIVFGANEISFSNIDGTPQYLNPPGTFQFTTSDAPYNATMFGSANSPVTATICAV
jgi:hypothetical protein